MKYLGLLVGMILLFTVIFPFTGGLSVRALLNNNNLDNSTYSISTNKGLVGTLNITLESDLNGTATISFNSSNFSVPYVGQNSQNWFVYSRVLQIPGNLSIGIYDISVEIIDKGNNSINGYWPARLVIQDKEPPDYTSGDNNSVVNNITNVTFNFWDPSSITSLVLRTNITNGTLVNWTTGLGTSNTTLVVQFKTNSSQKVLVNVTVNDSWNNSKTYSFLELIDLDPPILSNLEIIPDMGNSSFGPWVGPEFNISLNVSDISSTVCWAEMNGTRVSQDIAGTGELTIPVDTKNTSFVTGNYSLDIKCKDEAGNQNNKPMDISLDVTPPSISWNSPNYWITNKNWIYANITARDNESGLNGCQINWANSTSSDSSNMQKTSGYWTYNITWLTEGNWTIGVECNDKAGNKQQANKTIVLDLTSPKPFYNWSATNSSITVNVNVSDHYLDHTILLLGSQNCTSNTSSFSCTFGNLTNNTNYTISITSYDKAGNMNETNFTSRTKANPVARFVFSPTSGYAPLKVEFNASESYDPDGTIVSFYWEFGDGANASGEVVNHTYASPGTYTAKLEVVDNDGLSSTATKVITVSSRPSGGHGGGGYGGGGYGGGAGGGTEPETKDTSNENQISESMNKEGSWTINGLKVEWLINYNGEENKSVVEFRIHGEGDTQQYWIEERIPAKFAASLGQIKISPKWDKMISWSPPDISWKVWLGKKDTFTIKNIKDGRVSPNIIEKFKIYVSKIPEPRNAGLENPYKQPAKQTSTETAKSQGEIEKSKITGLLVSPKEGKGIAIILVFVIAGLLAAYMRLKELEILEKKYPLKYKTKK